MNYYKSRVFNFSWENIGCQFLGNNRLSNEHFVPLIILYSIFYPPKLKFLYFSIEFFSTAQTFWFSSFVCVYNRIWTGLEWSQIMWKVFVSMRRSKALQRYIPPSSNALGAVESFTDYTTPQYNVTQIDMYTLYNLCGRLHCWNGNQQSSDGIIHYPDANMQSICLTHFHVLL